MLILITQSSRTTVRTTTRNQSVFTRVIRKIHREIGYHQDKLILQKFNSKVEKTVELTRHSPVIFFNASSRLEGLSQNAAFSIVAANAVRAHGVPVIHFMCNAGMTRCMLGTNWQQPDRDPPCKTCIKQSRRIFPKLNTIEFTFRQDETLSAIIRCMTFRELAEFEYKGLPLGKLTLPSLRWTLRRHHLADSEQVRFLFREFILSAWNIGKQFAELLENYHPTCVVVFNGQTFPEATVKYVAKQRNMRVVTHEVAIQPLSAFFSEGEATAYPIDIPTSFKMTRDQDQKLDEYLGQRFQGNFTMAGIRFWSRIQKLDQDLENKLSKFNSVVPIFTNVVFDTSQVHANTFFDNMFDWLDSLPVVFKKNKNTLFIIRAHPDEKRIGKESQESVSQWVEKNSIANFKNVLFVDSNVYLSSYELIQRSKFVMIFNSTIGLEATLLRKQVLAAGKSRFTQMPIVTFPADKDQYHKILNALLLSDKVELPEQNYLNARKFLYYQLFRTSLTMAKYLKSDKYLNGFTHLRKINPSMLIQENSYALNAITDGILEGKPFLMPESSLNRK